MDREFQFQLPELIMEFNNVQLPPYMRRRLLMEHHRLRNHLHEGMDEEFERARVHNRQNIVISVPFCNGKVSELKSDLLNGRLSGIKIASLEQICVEYILKNQAKFCKPSGRNSISSLSPRTQIALMSAVQDMNAARDSPVYFEFLCSLLNPNTWVFRDSLVTYSMNSEAIYQLLLKNCHRLQELYLSTSSFLSSYLDSPTLDNLNILHCLAIGFNDERLKIISRLKCLRHLKIEVEQEVTEAGVSSLSNLAMLDSLEFRMTLPYSLDARRLDERMAVLFFQYVPHAHLHLISEVNFVKTSYALWTHFQLNQPQQMGQRCIRLVDQTDQHLQLAQLLPRLETLYFVNKFQEFTPENVEPLMKFPELSQIFFRNTSVHLCRKFFLCYGQKLVEISVKECFAHQDCVDELDLSLLFFHCPNLRKIVLYCGFAQEMQFPLHQSSFDALQHVELASQIGKEPPQQICELMLRGKNLQTIFVTTHVTNVINSLPNDFCFGNLESAAFQASDSGEEDGVMMIQNSLLKLVFNSPKLQKLTVSFGDSLQARQSCNPVKYVCDGILKVEFL